MNYFELPAYSIMSLDNIDTQTIERLGLTLPHYFVYQLVMMENQKNPSKIYQNYLDDLFVKGEENDDFRHGVIDAFCEIVKAGVKRIAFSHATSDFALFTNDLNHAHMCCRKYGISYYLEEELIQTCLFKNSGKFVIIFYSDPKNIEDYLKLKEDILSNSNPTREEERSYGRRLGHLLSYSEQRIEAMIEDYYASIASDVTSFKM